MVIATVFLVGDMEGVEGFGATRWVVSALVWWRRDSQDAPSCCSGELLRLLLLLLLVLLLSYVRM